MTAYYNENNPVAAAVLRELAAANIIAPGHVDDRSIKDVTADDLKGFTQCHFFAGAGLWSIAARMAGWPDRRPIWSASCPCQPYSAAGKRAGADDPRHLWPDLFRLVRDARVRGFGPPIIVGEQVSGSAGYGWFDGVRADLATKNYPSRARDIPACAVDAIMATLEADPATRSYEPYWNGARYRPAVEEALRVEHRSKAS